MEEIVVQGLHRAVDLVRDDRHFDAVLLQLPDRVQDAVVGAGRVRLDLRVHLFERGERLFEQGIILPARDRVVHEVADAVADKVAHLLQRPLLPAEPVHGRVDGGREVGQRIQQRAVEVEDDKFGFHKIALYAANVRLFHP